MTRLACVVLAAGKGTRMKSRRAKVLHPLAGRPMIEHVLASVAPLSPDMVVVVANDELVSGLANIDPQGLPVRTAVQETQLGTGDAVASARAYLEGFDGDVLVLYGDTPLLRPETLSDLLDARRASDAAVSVLGFRPEDPAHYGRLIIGADGMLDRIVEFKDADEAERACDLCNAGLMALDGRHVISLLDGIGNENVKGEYYLTDVVSLARARGLGARHAIAPPEEVMGVNDRLQLAAAEALVQARLRARAMAGGATLIDPASTWFSFDTRLGQDVLIGPNVFFGPGVSVESDVEIKAFSHLEGVRVERGAVIGPFARLRPGSEIGADARIGNFVELKNTRVEAGAKVNHLSYVGDARVGEAANVGAGTITCNYDGYKKSKTDIGAGAFIGSNSALVAPVTIGDGAVVGAGSVITRDVEADAIAVARGEQTAREGAAARRRARRGQGRAAE